MFTDAIHGPTLGKLNHITLTTADKSGELFVLWPDNTRYTIKETDLDNIASIKPQLSQSGEPKTFEISNNNFINILFHEFQKLRVEFGLLPITAESKPSSPWMFHLGLTRNNRLILTTPILNSEKNRVTKPELIENNGDIISTDKYLALVDAIKTKPHPIDIPKEIKSYIHDKYPLQAHLKTLHQSVINLKQEHMPTPPKQFPLLNDSDDFEVTEEMEQLLSKLTQVKNSPSVHQLLATQKALSEDEMLKINRFMILFNLLSSLKSLEAEMQSVTLALNINQAALNQYLEQGKKTKPEIVSPAVSQDLHIKPSTDEDLNIRETNWLTDNHIDKVGKTLLAASTINSDTYLFDSLVTWETGLPHSLYTKVNLFKESSAKYHMIALNLDAEHWVYVFMYKDADHNIQALYLDSRELDELKPHVQSILSQMQELEVELQMNHLECQKDGYNCGVWMLHFMEKTIAYLETHQSINRTELLAILQQPVDIEEKRQIYASINNEIKADVRATISFDFSQDYLEIEQRYQEIAKLSAADIQQWAQQKRQAIKTPLAKQDLLEAIAYIDHCYFLSSNGNRLRTTQKQAILCFFQKNDVGHIAQINTGEGKTTIVACVQALKVLLQGYKGQVFTSNCVLAEDGVVKNETFYQLLNISVAHNNADPAYMDGPRACYSSDIVYGTINNFQFDWLRHEFECQRTMGENFSFDNTWAMLDEIDSLLIDEGGNLAKLSVPFPGMSSLEIVYLTIWEELILCEKKHIVYDEIYKQFMSKESLQTLQQKLQALIDGGQVPKHLNNYLQIQLPNWLKSALDAKYIMEKNIQYSISVNDGSPNILPIDHENTGVSMHNTVLSNGLHHFLQIKHGLPLSFESPTSSFVSNLGFVQKFNNKISGVTGTIGGEAEQTLLQKKIKLDFSIIPPFQEKKFMQYLGQQIDDHEFIEQVARYGLSQTLDATEETDKARSSLIICSSIKDVNDIHKAILELAKQAGLHEPKIRLYRDETEAKVTQTPLDIGEIVIATNISGRGTDFHTTDALEKNGGLHVIEAFLPCNQRVQDQGFGRTARQGKSGTGQMLIRSSEVEQLPLADEYDFDDIIQARDEFESQRLEQIKQSKLAELEYHDRLFDCFSKLYQEIKKKNKFNPDRKWHYALKDLKEKWAMWLVENANQYSVDADLNAQYAKFEQEAIKIVEGEVNFNPYYVIQLAESYLNEPSNYKDRAKQQLLRLINPDLPNAFNRDQINKDMLHQAYMLLFEVNIEDGQQTLERFKQAIAELFNIDCSIDTEYLTRAREHLEQAKHIIEQKIQELQAWVGESADKPGRIENILKSADCYSHENNLLKHLNSKLQILNINHQKILSLIDQASKFKDGATLEKSCHHLQKILIADAKDQAPEISELAKVITPTSLKQFEAEGVSAIYELKPVHPVPPKVLNISKLQIGGGIALLGVALWFPWVSAVIGPVAGMMISEGITDIIFHLIDQSEFNEHEYKKAKLISYGISVATMGIGAILQCTKMVKKVVDYTRKLAARLQKAEGIFAGICKHLGTLLDKLADYLEKMLFMAQKVAGQEEILAENLAKGRHAQFEKLDKLKKVSDLSVYNQIKQIGVSAVKDGIKSPLMNIAMDKVLTPALTALLSKLKTHIEEHVKATVRQQPQLRDYSKEHLSAAIITTFRETSIDEGEILRKIGLGMMKTNADWRVQLATFVIESVIAGKDIAEYTEKCCLKFKDEVMTHPRAEAPLDEDTYNALMDSLSHQISEGIFSKVLMLTQHSLLELPKIIRRGHQYFKDKKESKQAVAQIQQRDEAVKNGLIKAEEAGANCATKGMANLLDMDEHSCAHAFDLLACEHGVPEKLIEQAFNQLGIQKQTLGAISNEAEAALHLQQHHSDRGFLIFKGEHNIDHMVPVKRNKHNQLFCYEPHVDEPIELNHYLAQKGSTELMQFVVLKNINESNIAVLQIQVKRNYINRARQSLELLAHDGKMIAGQKQKNKSSKNAKAPDAVETVLDCDVKDRIQKIHKAKYESLGASEVNRKKAEQELEIVNRLKLVTKQEKLGLTGQIELNAIADRPTLIQTIEKIKYLTTTSVDFDGEGNRTYRLDNNQRKFCYELQRNDDKHVQRNSVSTNTSVAVVHYLKKDFDILDAKYPKIIPEIVKLALIESYQRQEKIYINLGEIPQLAANTVKKKKGFGFFSESRNSPYDYWLDYQETGLVHLLKIRLNALGVDQSTVMISQALDLEKNNIESVIKHIKTRQEALFICLPILIPIDRDTSHWVGVVMHLNQGVIEVSYLDSENQAMTVDVQQAIETIIKALDLNAKIILKTPALTTQHFNNCGLELIENITKVITGSREEESLVLELHQDLYLQDVLFEAYQTTRHSTI